MASDDRSSDDFERRIEKRYPILKTIPSENATRAAGSPDRRALQNWITPTEAFFVLNHYPTPDIDADAWTLSLSGDIDEPCNQSLAELREQYSETTVIHTMECAGNGRAYFESCEGLPEKLVQWRDEAVATARWTGVSLRALLEDKGITAEGTWLTALGGDAPEGEEVFARSIPIEKALDDCILAYEMNGNPLPPEHGYPVRLLVPGWYGVNSVKWLSELRVMDHMITGPEWEQYTRWQQRGYRLTGEVGEEATEYDSVDMFDIAGQFEAGVDHPYTYNQNVMSLLAVTDGTTLHIRADGTIELPGMAWAGDNTVEHVEVSFDNGTTWGEAEFARPPVQGAWRPFRYVTEAMAGEYRVVSCATDETGETQPEQVAGPDEKVDVPSNAYPWNPGGYGNNAYRAYGVTVTVRSPGN